MDISSLLARADAAAPLTLSRSGPATVARLAAEAVASGRGAVVVVRSRDELALMRGLTALFTPDLSVGRADKSARPETPAGPVWDRSWAYLPPFNHRSLSLEGWAGRLAVLYGLSRGVTRGLVLTADNLIPRLPPTDFFSDGELVLRRGEDMSPDLLLEHMGAWGYQRVSMVAHAGDMARRGDIFDVLPPGYDKPLRLEFFGDTIDEMRVFDPSSQRSVGQLDEATLLPVSPVRRGRAAEDKMRGRWKRLFQKGLLAEFAHSSLLRAMEQADIRLTPGVAYDASTFLEAWLPRESLWFLPGRRELEDGLAEADRAWRAALAGDIEETRLDQPEHLVLRDADAARVAVERAPRAYAEPLLMGVAAGTDDESVLELPERTYRSFADLFPGQPDRDRPWQQMAAGLKQWTGSRRQVVLAFASERGRRKFLKLAEQDGLLPSLRYDPAGRGLFALVAPLHQGAEMVWDDSLILGEDLLQPRAERGRRVASGAFKGLDSYDDLTPATCWSTAITA